MIAYKEKANGSDFDPPNDTYGYAQLDYWLTGEAWKRSCTDVHSILEARLELLPCQRARYADETSKFEKPDHQQWERFNHDFAVLVSRAIHSVLFQNGRKSLISPETHGNFQNKEIIITGKNNDIKHLNRQIVKAARNDRKKHLIEQLNENSQDKKKGSCKAVKDLKRKFTPQYVQMRIRMGRMCL